MKRRFLSYPVSENAPVYGSTRKPEFAKVSDMDSGAHCNVGEFSMGVHAGTHVDAPSHFDRFGKRISDYTADDFVFERPLVIYAPAGPGELLGVEPFERAGAAIADCDIILVRTGFCDRRNEPEYYQANPGFSTAAADYIRRRATNLRCLGIDSVSVSSFLHREEGRAAHRIFFNTDKYDTRPLLLIEDMDLSGEISGVKKIILAPLMLEGMEGAPCAVMSEIETDEVRSNE